MCDVGLPRAARPGDEDGDFLGDEAAGGELGDEGLVDGGIEVEVELLEGFRGAEAGAADAQVELLVLASGDFVGDERPDAPARRARPGTWLGLAGPTSSHARWIGPSRSAS